MTIKKGFVIACVSYVVIITVSCIIHSL